MHPKPVIAFNLLFVEAGPLTGPGYYAVQLFEHIVRLKGAKAGRYEFAFYAQEAARHHFSATAQAYFRPVPSFTGRWPRVAYEQILLPRRANADRVDLLFSPGFVSPLWGGKHRVAAICDMYYRVVPELVEKYQRLYWQVCIPLTSRACERLITISQNSLRDIERYLPAARGKTISIPLASRFAVRDGQANPPGSPAYVLMIANLTPNKNCEVVVEAVAKLREKGREIQFIHVGRDVRGRLAAKIEELQAQDYVRSLGKVDDNRLTELYQSCLCVIVPSLYEGFGMPAIEAQALGAPLVCSDSSALPEAAGDAALYFDPHSVDELVTQIERLLDEPGLRQELVSSGFRNASTFSWEDNARRSLDVFDDVLAGPAA